VVGLGAILCGLNGWGDLDDLHTEGGIGDATEGQGVDGALKLRVEPVHLA
jgi:hypothetical protein